MSKESQIVEVLEDGTIHAFDLDVCDKEAEGAIKKLYKKEGKLFNFDFSATVFTLFVYCIHILSEAGWSSQELVKEVLNHTSEHEDDDDDDDDY
jgi:hypothetical protein